MTVCAIFSHRLTLTRRSRFVACNVTISPLSFNTISLILKMSPLPESDSVTAAPNVKTFSYAIGLISAPTPNFAIRSYWRKLTFSSLLTCSLLKCS